MNLSEEKKHLRDSIAERLKKMSKRDRDAESRTLCREIAKLIPHDAHVIAAYVPLPSEADITPLLTELLAQKKRVFLPCFENKKLIFREAQSLEELSKGELNIMEPPKDTAELEPANLDLALIPARAYSQKGERLGRGNGGYDIWIREQRSTNPKTQFWGIALECQILNEIPMEPHDETVDMVITARGRQDTEQN
ncbi:5-formyltetrahydrofolate cyclo-ligase [Candidatus Peregrinibacteria bacterium]|nr:5-formyltetrahydrofolate cyclo-ligase [Candidatus Peregrinibacteria bacterium]